MRKQIKVPVKLLLISALAVLSMLTMSSLSLATSTDPGGDRFEIIRVSGSSAYFSILDEGDCDGTDENCTVKVTRPSSASTPSTEAEWNTQFTDSCDDDIGDSASEGNQNEDFEECWPSGYEVEWPIIEPEYKFDITPYCESGDDDCAIDIAVCYNPEDCDPADESARDSDQASSHIGELWDDAGRCLYDDDEDDVWECIDDEFQDWLDDADLRSSDDYDDLIDELEDDNNLGVATDDDDDYDDDLNEVGPDGGDDDDDEDEETSVETYQRRWRNASVTDVLEEEDEIDEGGYSFRPSRDEYLTIDFTAYLELQGNTPICNTSLGCFTLVGSSSFFQQYLTNFYIQITDRKIVDCMDDLGYDVDDEHNVALNNPDLISCDERIAEAVDLCPSENIGAQYVLYEMYSFGLLRGILSDSAARTIRTNLETARVRTPECLCAAGFRESDMIISERFSEDADPWFSTSARRPADVCR